MVSNDAWFLLVTVNGMQWQRSEGHYLDVQRRELKALPWACAKDCLQSGQL